MYLGTIVERGPVRDVLKDPQHPYTRGLLQAIPSLDRLSRRLHPVPGDIPSPSARPKGCPFQHPLRRDETGPVRRDRAPRNPVRRQPLGALPSGRARSGANGMKGRAMDTLIEVRNLEVGFPVTKRKFLTSTTQTLRAVDGVSFDIRRGETVGLVGESGSGKTTVGRAILRAIDPTGGEVIYHTDTGDVDLAHADDATLQKLRPQSANGLSRRPRQPAQPVGRGAAQFPPPG